MSLTDPTLSGRVALITGSGRGIGLGIAQALARSGVAVVIHDIELDVAQASAADITRAGGKAIALPGDINDLSVAKTLVDQTLSQLGGLHIVVQNASIQTSGSWLQESAQVMAKQYQANILFPLELTKAATPIFRAQKWGRIIHIGSIHQKGPHANMLGYGLTKIALEGVNRALARDFVRDGVTVNLVSPGYFNTFRNRDQFQTPEDDVKRGKAVPMQRAGDPSDVGGIVVALCSDACAYITGQTIFVDGGMSVG